MNIQSVGCKFKLEKNWEIAYLAEASTNRGVKGRIYYFARGCEQSVHHEEWSTDQRDLFNAALTYEAELMMPDILLGHLHAIFRPHFHHTQWGEEAQPLPFRIEVDPEGVFLPLE